MSPPNLDRWPCDRHRASFSPLRYLILNRDYPSFLEGLYADRPALSRADYAEQLRVRNETLFGVADFYSFNLRRCGHEAHDIHANNLHLQNAWMCEHGFSVERSGPPRHQALAAMRALVRRTPLRRLRPLLSRQPRASPWSNAFYRVLAEQIRHYRPDVVLNQAMDGIASEFLAEMKPHMRLLVGQIAAPLPQGEDFRPYDLVLSSLPNFVARFRQQGLRSELHRFAFEPRVAEQLNGQDHAAIQLSFVGSLSASHGERLQLLEHLAASSLPLQIWGNGAEALPEESQVRRRHAGHAWGLAMYRVLQVSRITLNHHIGIAESYANNMRLFEATGVGTLLVTDAKQNLHELFEPGREVVTYRNPPECAELIQHYLEHDDERCAIAAAGHRRTLRDHTYVQRAEELTGLLKRYV